LLPISLTVRNFLSYKDAAPTLRLEDMHVACLCGANGNGKSALLDAITWALWGKARGQRQEQLIHHGQDEMSVELEFDIGTERYRVTRRYSTARRTAQTSLELAVLTGDDYRPITSDTIRDTEADIVRRTSMDYDTFVNSAFLVQGRADLFTMSTPTQRKEVLSKVMGLGLYDRLEERAKLRNRELQGTLSASAHNVNRLHEQVAQGEALRDSLTTVEEELAVAQQSVDNVGERLALLRRQVELLKQRQAGASELDAQAARAKTQGATAFGEAQELERRINEWRRAVARRAAIEDGFKALEQARETVRKLNTAVQSIASLQRELAPLEQRITSAKAGMEGDLRAQRHRLEVELAPKAASLAGIEQAVTKAKDALALLDTQASEESKAADQEQGLRLDVSRLLQDNERITALGIETKNKIALLDADHDHGHADGVACPLCGTALEADAKARIEASYQAELTEQRQLFVSQAEQAKSRGAQADTLAAQAKGLLQRLEADRRALDAELARLNVQREEAAEAQAGLADAKQAVTDAQARLDRGDYAVDEQATATTLRAQIAGLAYDFQAVGVAEAAQAELEHWDPDYRALGEAQARLPEDEEAHARAKERVAEAEADSARIEAQRAAIAKEVAELPTYLTQRATVEQEAAAAGKQRDELQAKEGSLAHQIEELVAAEAELKELESGRKEMVQEAGAYGELALAFGKGGVQALLIEAAIPRLEDEANDLLKQMTDGRMSLKLETQRERRTGRAADGSESIETLDIVIADELGTRSYEMFSGGERFRVDFALRIALSKLLAWRAGAPLPTLFIDEGFGTQDAEGRDRILDVIKAIEDRFQRILVITHLEEVKEAFPVRIEVTRTVAGSTFSLS
jgi:exonuclease SbcC